MICILVAAFPWKFGAYQNQAYMLSQTMDAYWMPHSLEEPMQEKIYTDVDSMFEQFKTLQKPNNPPNITFVGYKPDIIKISRLNRLAKKYNIHKYIMIGDIVKVLRDVDFKVKAMIWFPHHYMHPTPHEKYTLSAFHVASLSPSSAKILNTTHIPHIVEVNTTKIPKFNTFTVLMQGGNYDKLDRKGWTAGLQAFKLFHKKYPNSRLILHALSSRNIAQHARNRQAPKGLDNKGLPLKRLIKLLEVPNVTLDDTIHSYEYALNLKKKSHVCMHASKVEGFGMNVLECQAVGTPVITTNFTAMADFTTQGITVPHQLEWFNDQGLVALPSVPHIAQALEQIHNNISLPVFDPGPFKLQRVAELFKQDFQMPVHPLWSKADRENYTESKTLWTLFNKDKAKLKRISKTKLVVIYHPDPFDEEGYIKDVPMAVRTHYLHTHTNIHQLLSMHMLKPEQVLLEA